MNIPQPAIKLMVLAAAIFIHWSPAVATDCVVGAYESYVYATQKLMPPYDRKIGFTCRSNAKVQVRFQADPAIGLRCAGTISKAAKVGKKEPPSFIVRARLFATPGSSITTAKGWRITDYTVAGGEIVKFHRRDSLIYFQFKVANRPAKFNYGLSTITLSKKNGLCANAVAEAFSWLR